MGMYCNYESQISSRYVARMIEQFPKLPMLHVEDESYMCWYTHDDLTVINDLVAQMLLKGFQAHGHMYSDGCFRACPEIQLIELNTQLNAAWEDQWHKNIRNWEAENKKNAQEDWQACMDYCDKQRLIFG